jgi:hypothetical protein
MPASTAGATATNTLTEDKLAINENDLDEIFEYHPPTPGQRVRYEVLRAAAKHFARTILSNTPPSPDQSAAIRKLRECVMTANAAVALDGKY